VEADLRNQRRRGDDGITADEEGGVQRFRIR
jgi:hypothetical protein